MLTEDQAKTKWCPYAGVVDDLSKARTATRMTAQATRCIASDCMAWRWKHKEARLEDGGPQRQHMNDLAIRTERHIRVDRKASPSSGYDVLVLDGTGFCGLAGQVAP